MPIDSQPVALSVVMPTLGGESLAHTISQMNRGKLVPSEILICIPAEDAYKVEKISFSNVRIIKTDCRGQVAQRAIGLQMAQYPVVLQLDDDIYIPEETLRLLLDALQAVGPGNVVGPVYYLDSFNRPSHELRCGVGGFINNLLTVLICGAKWGIERMGTVTNIGTSYGVDDRFCDSNSLFETEWLPGGCLLSYKDDLVLGNFFPLAGKAFCEDLIHSHLRTQKGIRHFVVPSAKCMIEYSQPDDTAKSVKAQRQAQRYYVSLIGGSLGRLRVYEIFWSFKRSYREAIRDDV